MTQSVHVNRSRLSAVALIVAGILFVLYPAIRPFSDEGALEGARAFASTEWMVAHIFAIFAFTLLPLGLHGLHASVQNTVAERQSYWAFVLCLVGAGLSLPFYGGETYGLNAIGQEATRLQDTALLGLAESVRGGVGLALFLVGLLLLSIGAILSAVAIWRSGRYPKWSGVALALGFALYIPQFFWSQPFRVAHGALVAIGCLWIAIGMLAKSDQKNPPA